MGDRAGSGQKSSHTILQNKFCRRGGIGRRAGFKIRGSNTVWVRPPSPAPAYFSFIASITKIWRFRDEDRFILISS